MITKICPACGTSFDVVPSQSRRRRYCSRECRYPPRPTVACEVCGKEFAVKPYRVETARFCSFECSGAWHQSQRPAMGNRFEKGNKLRLGLCPVNAFTSEDVRGENNHKWVEGLVFTCLNCQTEFSVKPWLVHQNGTPKFCSRPCQYEYLRGENHPLYVGGPQTYRGRGWREARLLAVERDGGICQSCGRVIGPSIPVHHIRPFREFDIIQKANALDNLICLCQSCHMKRERAA